jgi:uncharacterized membrane protein YkoI
MLANLLKYLLIVSWFAGENVAVANDDAPPKCFSTAQTREQIVANKLVEPFASMQAIARAGQGDPIGVKLCRIDDKFMYEVNMLRRDGHVVKILVDATTGEPHSRRRDLDH